MTIKSSGPLNLSHVDGVSADYIDSLYQDYLVDENSVEEKWRIFFSGFDFAKSFKKSSTDTSISDESFKNNARVEALINAYRRLGHLFADLNPISQEKVDKSPLNPKLHGLDEVVNNYVYKPANFVLDSGTLPEIIQVLKDTYCRKIGADFRDMNNIDAITWMQQKMESTNNKPKFTKDEQRRIHLKLCEAQTFEAFLGQKYIGKKRFSLEGVDSLISMLDTLIADAYNLGGREINIGMAHRGRLNILANFMGKDIRTLLQEFEESEFNEFDIDGDVKYHLGFASNVTTSNGNNLDLYLSPNPSHLEAVNPVIIGAARSRQTLRGDLERKQVIPILLHGDAAFMGQGLVAETFNLSGLENYKVGGTIHIITNNQIGFTTFPENSRSGHYASDISKMIRAPVLHVNADDPEAVAWCAKLAIEFRQRFGQDIVIDLIGYRRHGHNEGDEPSFTQPLMYKIIKKHPTVLKQYEDYLIAKNIFDKDFLSSVNSEIREHLVSCFDAIHGKKVPQRKPQLPSKYENAFKAKKVVDRKVLFKPLNTKVSKKSISNLSDSLTLIEPNIQVHNKIKRLFATRAKMLENDKVDWGFAELLALASILQDKHNIRISGQDVQRGTFSSRHAVVTDVETNEKYDFLAKIAESNGSSAEVINSPLSEQGCLGFEYGYSVMDHSTLVLWEAQFGDFSNGAQIIIDQFLSACEAKWHQTSNLVLLLPHGHEGMGPEHSSARPERYLQLCGNLNIQVVIPTTPAQHFHLLRRQVKTTYRKPLVVITPKSLLRHPKCVSKQIDFTDGVFSEVIDDKDIQVKTKKSAKKAILCSGKIYYELIAKRDELKSTMPIIRLEQLYPFPYDQLSDIIKSYPKLEQIVWTQEEPQNMGGWNFIRGRILLALKNKYKLNYVGRKNSGTPAEGTSKGHTLEQNRIVAEALKK